MSNLFGSISISVGANINPLKNELDAGINEIEDFGKSAAMELKQATHGIERSMSGTFSNISHSVGDMAKNIADNSSKAAGEFHRLGSATRGLKGPLSNLNESTSESIMKFGEMAEIAGFAADGLTGLKEGAAVLGATFPKVGKVVAGAMSMIWKAITGPIGIAAAALTGLATLIATNFEKSIKIITRLANWFITLYNEILPLRIAVEAIILPFKQLFVIGESGAKTFKVLFETMAQALKMIKTFQFDQIGKVFEAGFSKIADIGKEAGAKMGENVREGMTNIIKGRELLTEDDVRSALQPLKNAKDFISGFLGFGGTADAEGGPISKAIKKDAIKAVELLDKQIGSRLTITPNIKIPSKADLTKKLSQFQRSIKEVMTDLGDNLGASITGGLFAAFEGADAQRLADLNEEIRENQKLLSDKSASAEDRKAAQERIKLLNMEVAAEKEKGNVAAQVGKSIIDTSKKAIEAALARAISNLIAAQAWKGLFGILAAGAGIIAIKGLFSKNVPKLSQGGILTRPTLFEGGEYPGAANNPEIVAPLDRLTGMMKKAMPQMVPARMDPVIVGGRIENELRGENLYQVLILQHENFKRRNGFNPFE